MDIEQNACQLLARRARPSQAIENARFLRDRRAFESELARPRRGRVIGRPQQVSVAGMAPPNT
jgi:hypothetical protein